MGAVARLALAWLAVFPVGCSVARRVATPVREPARPLAAAEAELDTLGRAMGPSLFAPEGVLRLPDTVLTGGVLTSFLAAEAEGLPRYQRPALETGRVYVCPEGVVQVGRYTWSEQLPGASRAVRMGRGWRALWERRGSAWRITDAELDPGPLERTWLGIDPACVGPTQAGMARRPHAVSVHWSGLWSRGAPAPGVAEQLRYAGAEPSATHRSAWTAGVGRRLSGPWGARLLAGWRRVTGGGSGPGGEPVELRSTSAIVGLLAMHERWLVRLAAGPAAARVDWEWQGPEPASSSDWSVGWVNEVALAVPVGGRFFLDVAYHDWLFGTSSPPAFLDGTGIDPRLRGSSLSLGLGGRF